MQSLSALLFDLDGTVYRGTDIIPGAVVFLKMLTERDIPYLFVTNRGNRTPDAIAAQLNDMGIPCGEENILTSAQAAANHIGQIKPQARVYVIGEEGVEVALEDAGAISVEETPDIVLVSYDRGIDYDKLTKATRFIHAGAQFIATNRDAIITVEDGILPEAGPLVSAIEAATGITPDVIGKPSPIIMKEATNRLNVSADECAIIGDFLLTDILAGHNANMRSVLILTGVSQREDLSDAPCQPTWIAEDYTDLERQLSDLLK